MAITIAPGAAAGARPVETTWVNPHGGAWANPDNWSAGVPTAGGTAILPHLDPDGYEVELSGVTSCGTIRVLGAGVALTGTGDGGQLSINSLVVGQPGAPGELTLRSLPVTAIATSVGGVGAAGTLVLSDSTQFGGGWITSGIGSGGSSSGLIEVRQESQIVAVEIVLGETSTLIVEARDAGPTLLADSLTRNGTLQALLPNGTTLPSPNYVVMTTWLAMTGSFDTITPVALDGYSIPLISGPTMIIVQNCDPLVSLDIETTSVPYVGFRSSLATIGTKLSGLEVPVSANYQLLDPSAATLDGAVLMPSSPAPFTLLASATTFGVPISGSDDIVASIAPPLFDDRVDFTESGDVSNGFVQYSGTPLRISPDGRWVAFVSRSTNLTPVDPWPEHNNVFLKDRWTGFIELIDDEGGWGDFPASSIDVDLSNDGRYVLFTRATASTWPARALWLRDRERGTTLLVSAALDGTIGNGSLHGPRISGDGRFVVYSSTATNIVEGVGGLHWMVFLYDVNERTTTLLSATSDHVPANGSSLDAAITPDGRYVAFSTTATNLTDDDAGIERLILIDRQSGVAERIDVASAGGGNQRSMRPSISADGRFVAFTSDATNLGAAPDSVLKDVFLRDRLLLTTTWLSLGSGLLLDMTQFDMAEISEDGSTVLFVAATGTFAKEIARVETSTGESETVAVDPWGEPAQPDAARADLTADGRAVLFATDPSLIVPFGADGTSGVFIRLFGRVGASDLNDDGSVNAADLSILLGAWSTSTPALDLDGDGVVGAGDVALLLGDWTDGGRA